MFALGTGMYKEMTKRDEYFVLVCGPESSGKTTFAEQFRVHCDDKFKMPKRTTSTIGLNLVKVNVDNFVLNFWDVGGNKELLSLWDRYIEDCHAIVFVVDPCGDDYIEDCLRALNKVMSFEHARRIPLMIVLNKCDLLDVHAPASHSGSSTCDEDFQPTDSIKQSSSSIRLEENGVSEDSIANNENGWTSQDDVDYDAYKAYGWEQPDFVPPQPLRTPSQCSMSTTSSMESSTKKIKNANYRQKTMLSRTQRLQHLRDACQDVCEKAHDNADMAVFSISALKAVNIDRCRQWLCQQLLTVSLPSIRA